MKMSIPVLLLAIGTAWTSAPAQNVLFVPGGNSRETYFTVHNLAAAHRLATGKDVKVGILDHYFGYAHHPGLYAGGENFLPDDTTGFREASEHGYWMALVLREVAPDVQIYALNTMARDGAGQADAMARAIDWAIAHDLDVLTYSGRAFSPAARAVLDPAVDRAHRAGMVTTFIHYPAAGNLLPGWIGPRTGDDGREPDVNILHFDYSRVFVDKLARWQAGQATGIGNHPFLSVSSTSVVTAGMVALLLSTDATLQPGAIKEILMATGRPYTVEGMSANRVADAHAALLRARSRSPRSLP